MTLNQFIQPGRPTVTDLLESMRNDAYFVDDSFQRRLVWTERQKARLIQTILIGYPMPEVYLWQQPPNPESGKQRHSIVDGQQRLTSLLQFTANEWALDAKHLDPIDGWEVYRGKFWKELDTESKSAFWQYVINVRTIPSDVSMDQITAVFKRLNETDKSLNPQELRNAQFNGEFIKAAEEITELPEFESLNIFRDSQVRRMADIEFTSSLLIFLRQGMVEESTASINKIYDLYNDEYPEAKDDVETVRAFFKRAGSEYMKSEDVRKFFTRPIHLFTLFCVDQVLIGRKANTNDVGDKLEKFVRDYQLQEAGKSEVDNALERYRTGSASRTRSRSNRALRAQSLLSKLL